MWRWTICINMVALKKFFQSLIIFSLIPLVGIEPLTFVGLKCELKNEDTVREFKLRNPSLVNYCLMGSAVCCDTSSVVKDTNMEYYCTSSNVKNTNMTCREKGGYLTCSCSFKETDSYRTCSMYKDD